MPDGDGGGASVCGCQRVRALLTVLVDGGDLTQAGARMLRQVLDAST